MVNYLARKRRRDIARQRWQFLAVGATVMLGVLMFAATYDSYQNLTASYQQTYQRLSFADMTVTGGADGLPATLRAVPGVAVVEVRHTADLPVQIGSATLVGRLVGMPVANPPAIDKIEVTSGRRLQTPGADDAVAEVHVARTFHLAPGDTFTVRAGGQAAFTVVGVAASAEYIWPAASTQEIFPDPNQFGVFFVDESLVAQLPPSEAVRETLVRYDPGADVAATDALVRKAALAAGATGILTQADHPSKSTLQLDVEGFGEMAVAFPFLFLTAAAMAVYVLLTRIVATQRALIGTLRASGVGAPAIRSHYLGFGLLVGGIGAALGVALGVVTGALMTSAYTGFLDIPDTVVEFRPLTLAIGLAFGIVAGLLAAWVPARAAYRTQPAEAMRGTSPLVPGGRSLAERLVPALSRLPVRARMTLRGIGRAKQRSLSTMVVVVLALVMVLAAGGMIDTIVSAINRQFNDVQLQDANAFASQPVDASLVAAVGGVPGVTRAEPVATLTASVSQDGTTISTVLQGYQPDTRMHGWTNPGASLPASGVLVTKSMAAKLDLKVGDTIDIALPTLGTSISMPVAGMVDETLGMPLYAATGAVSAALSSAGVSDPGTALAAPTVTSVQVLFGPGADRASVLHAIGGVPGILAAEDARSLYNSFEQYLGLFYLFTGIMLAFGGVMALALMFNTISVNIAERSGEFATLKANGMADRTIAVMIMGENLLLTVLGIVPGLVLGTLAAYEFILSFNNDSFSFGLSIEPLTYVVAAAAMVVVALLSMVPGIRSVRRLDIGAVVRERSV